MSAWRLFVQRVHLHGPASGSDADRAAIREARELGLIVHNGRTRWRLTPLGLAYCEGRAALVRAARGIPAHFVATWLASLPRHVTIERSSKNSRDALHANRT
jgi:hypothetical protein